MKNYLELAASLLEYKSELSALMMSLNPEDVRRGRLVLEDHVLSDELHSAVLSQTKGLLEDYRIRFHNGQIQVSAEVQARQLGPLSLKYDITLQEFRFDASGHKVFADFRETAISNGNVAQKLAVKAALLNGPLLKTAAQFLKKPFLHVDVNHLFADLDKLPQLEKVPDHLEIRFISCIDGRLTFSLHL